MNRGTVDEATANVLLAFHEETVLLGSDGKVIGRFVPGTLTDEEVYARAHEFLDIEEAKRRKVTERGNGSPLSEILNRMGVRETTP